MPPVPKSSVVKDPAYLHTVRQMPCHFIRFGFMECNPFDTLGLGRSEVSHLQGKSRDDCTLPMCGGHHRTNRVSWHSGQRTFCTHYGITKAELLREAAALYRAYQEGK